MKYFSFVLMSSNLVRRYRVAGWKRFGMCFFFNENPIYALLTVNRLRYVYSVNNTAFTSLLKHLHVPC